jgi:enamine deaminase RidA (YjgF/YER057c/UK114 family)
LIERHASGGPWEDVVAYSRVVRAGEHVWVAGCTGTLPDGTLIGLGDPYAQAVQTIENIAAALNRAGASLHDVVRTRISIVEREHVDAVARAHREAFGEVRPATALYVVAGLLDPRMLVEIEADAVSVAR